MSRRSRFTYLAALTPAFACLVIASGVFASGGPTVTTGTASAVADNGATVSGSVNPNGQATTYAFEYGTSAHYTNQSGVQSVGAATQPLTVNARLGGLRPGTTYHFRMIASNAGGTATGADATFTTTGIAPPTTSSLQTTTGPATEVSTSSAKLSGTINSAGAPAGETERYYFQLGTSQPYSLQTVSQTFLAGGAPIAASVPVSGLQSMQLFHYRLVAERVDGQLSVGADQTFTTLPKERLRPVAVKISASPVFQRAIPDRVTVSGRMVPPSSLSNLLACRGYFDITFRVGQVAVQSLRAGIHKDCTFSLPVVFHSRSRLRGGHVIVHVLFAGNRFLHRLEAPPKAIQVG
jgi:hypothetical protein